MSINKQKQRGKQERIITSLVTTDGGFGWVIGFIEHLQILTTSAYSAFAKSRTLQFSSARINFSQCVLSSSVAW
jgi:hypothetical protein